MYTVLKQLEKGGQIDLKSIGMVQISSLLNPTWSKHSTPKLVVTFVPTANMQCNKLIRFGCIYHLELNTPTCARVSKV